jgi:hypothetical protein
VYLGTPAPEIKWEAVYDPETNGIISIRLLEDDEYHNIMDDIYIDDLLAYFSQRKGKT